MKNQWLNDNKANTRILLVKRFNEDIKRNELEIYVKKEGMIRNVITSEKNLLDGNELYEDEDNKH